VIRSQGSSPTPPRSGRISVTDLGVLVLGVAVALSFPWFNPWVQPPNEPFREPRWRIISLFVEEAVGKASLALIPLMLYRRARLGGLCRPGELLLPICAACIMCDHVGRVTGLGRDNGVIEVENGYWVILTTLGMAVMAALLGAIYLADRLSDGIRSSLLVLAVAGSYPWPSEIMESLKFRLLDGSGGGDLPYVDYSFFVAFYAVEHVIPAVIGIAALSDAIRGRLRDDAMSIIGLTIASTNLVVCLALYLPSYYTSAFPPWNNHLFYVLLAAPVASGLLGTCLFLALVPRWRRWFQ
jgi:hypothetical protein